MNTTHQSVLLQEALDGLRIVADGLYIDGTFGRGGHSRAILERLGPDGRLLAFDKDHEAIAYAQAHFAQDARFTCVHASFADLALVAQERGIAGQIDGILLDLGVSSPQLDQGERGFSFMHNGPLDMRMDVRQRMDARTFVMSASVDEMTRVFRDYGEERFAGRIARAIDEARQQGPIDTSHALANVVKAANPRWEKHKHPATRVFQAIRIHINQELQDLERGLEQSVSILKAHGRLAVISFHSLEDRLVKRFMRFQEQGEPPVKGMPLQTTAFKPCFKRVGKAIKPQASEMLSNVRSRSAILRIGEKIA